MGWVKDSYDILLDVWAKVAKRKPKQPVLDPEKEQLKSQIAVLQSKNKELESQAGVLKKENHRLYSEVLRLWPNGEIPPPPR
jgi:hypothetical protein